MKIVLLENVRKVGSIGEIIDVKRGFARNFLISKKKALFASKENVKEVEKIKQDLSKKDQEKKKKAKNIQEKIQNKEFEVKKLSIFAPQKYKFKKNCPLSGKGAPVVDYKNIKLLKKYISENGKIMPSRITSVSQKKQRELSLSIKRARNLALLKWK